MLKTIFMQQYDTNSLHTEEELDAIINDFKSIAVGLKVSDASWSSFVSEIKRHISVKVVTVGQRFLERFESLLLASF